MSADISCLDSTTPCWTRQPPSSHRCCAASTRLHLAAALALGTDLSEVITYDERMAIAAMQLGLSVAQPR